MLYIMTLAEMKSVLGIGDTEDDTVLSLWLETIQGRFDQHCRRRFLYSASETEYFDGGVTALYVHRWPVASISSIIVDADQAWSSDDALATDDYRLNNRRGSLFYGTGGVQWPWSPQSIRVVYAGGFVKSDGTVADHVDDYELEALRRAFLLQANFEWRNRETLGISQVSQQGSSIQQGAQPSLALKQMTLLPEVESTLQPFKRIL